MFIQTPQGREKGHNTQQNNLQLIMQSTRLLKILKFGYNTYGKIMEKQKYRHGAGGPIWKTFLFAAQQF